MTKAIYLAAAAWPLAARAQRSAMPVVDFLRSTPSAPFQNLVVAFGQGLKEEGFVEGQNAVVDYRYADNQIGVPYSQLRIFGASVPRYRLDWIVVSYSRVATGAFWDTALVVASGAPFILLADWCLTRSYERTEGSALDQLSNGSSPRARVERCIGRTLPKKC
jgi:hypothetical protein